MGEGLEIPSHWEDFWLDRVYFRLRIFNFLKFLSAVYAITKVNFLETEKITSSAQESQDVDEGLKFPRLLRDLLAREPQFGLRYLKKETYSKGRNRQQGSRGGAG